MWNQCDISGWKEKRRGDISGVLGAVRDIVDQIERDGDAALLDLTERFDRIRLDTPRILPEEVEEAYEEVDDRLVEALCEAEARITRFHELQKSRSLWLEEIESGITLGVRTRPLDRVGCYVPGGRAAYPSTVLMTAVPARVAGVPEICCCTPPPADPLTVVAMDIAGVTECYRVGGAQAIAAMAIGTETIRPVDKIVGPGNVYVTAAKMILRDRAEIDFPAGPSEIGIIADMTADPSYIAADVLAQAEHDPHSASVLVTTDAGLAERVGEEIARMVASSPRREIIEEALTQSGYVIASSRSEAVRMMNEIAPEHLSLQVADPMALLQEVGHAGSIFVGPWTPVACGDYASGTNHVLPTAGYARVHSGLDVHHFCTRSQVQILTEEGLAAIGDVVEALAEAEGLYGHAESVRVRRRG
ncbi:MAG: Histidinol dehydrogenase [Methanomicrobiales archaeon 53_19]|uniref:histidinol dehydrogenase n=1 Tax=Methanocalculus sp. TaxID=2004547 RepID=UPI000746D66F|nr:histidinol dehydrogenase [Methanocalculus sp.]KUK69006.1 MAG: Histidinol dehydrogenase [Methanocalculus sp. 52_23]KUL04176.1 MAG: Histidinol dehydrogenase [Methanomicrobiales archaeon 53_19]HIJ07600.1 histidinol dehydrogenase [Methanocalculus sp.]